MACRISTSRNGVSRLLLQSQFQVPVTDRCQPARSVRHYATETESATTSGTTHAMQGATSSHDDQHVSHELSTMMLLSRPPTIQRAPSAFEAAYYAYNSKMQRILSQPLMRDLYFKKGSATETSFDKDEKERRRNMEAGAAPVSRHLSVGARGAEGGVDSSSSSSSSGIAQNRGSESTTHETMPRITKADTNGDRTSLERSLDRTLFLLVRGGSVGKTWTLPTSLVHKRDGAALHKEAPQALHKLLGKDMDIWMVTNVPVGVTSASTEAKRSYVMRAHILAGKPTPSTKDVEFAWLTSEEMKEQLPATLYSDVRDLLCA